MKEKRRLVVLAGQPNCGKSTIFNALTGARQHVANYPGVTVDKMTGWYRHRGVTVEVVDLPGTYSLGPFSPEERVSRDFIIRERTSAVVNVADASNLKRCLYLTFQLLEMGRPVILNLNMMDVAEKRGLKVDITKLSEILGVSVVPTVMKKGRGKRELQDIINDVSVSLGKSPAPAPVDYGDMESFLKEIQERLSLETGMAAMYPARWLSIKLMEGDSEAERLIRKGHRDADDFMASLERVRKAFETLSGDAPEIHIANLRYQRANEIAAGCVGYRRDIHPLSDRIDGLVCHKVLGPVILAGIIWLLYYLSIVQGYRITGWTWPVLSGFRDLVGALVPDPGFLEIPLVRSFALWLTDSVNALLNYIPIFFILFGLIALLEDSGYMPRMAFIMDRLFKRYGLHGQSTLPMILGGVYVGGCAVPGVMSCKGIPDERSRMATILIIPLLNCLAKTPLYVLLVNIYFSAHKGIAMFFISVISLLLALPVARVLTMTILRDKEKAPFVMEMPPYHMPTLRGVFGRAFERIWLFLRKITTIVAAVAVIIFILLQFPGLSNERTAYYNREKERIIGEFMEKVGDASYEGMITEANIMEIILYWSAYKDAKMKINGKEAVAAMKAEFNRRDPLFFSIAQPGDDREAKKVNRAFRSLFKERLGLLREMRKERIDNSFLGKLGAWLEPVTAPAGFNRRVNIALLSALAAKESSVATLGAIYEQEEGETLEQRMGKEEKDFTSLHALALMLFMVLYPPCIATAIAVRLQTGSVKWMIFSIVYPMVLGLSAATLVYSGGSALGLSGLQAMGAFFVLALAITVLTGFLKEKPEYT